MAMGEVPHSAAEVPAAPSLEVVKLTKHFGPFKALTDVSFKVQAGECHALLGENGAGKSTLVKCVIGYQPPTDGQILYDEQEVSFTSTREAHAIGIGRVYQQFTLVPNMTVAENLVLVRDHVPAVVNWKREMQELSDFMDQQPFKVGLKSKVRSISAGEKQKLEILKQLYLKRKFLILDEPTSVLTPQEADEVLGLLHEKTRKKELTILIITHKFREVTSFCDSVSVLRRGEYVGGGLVNELSTDQMAELMIGSEKLTVAAPRTKGLARDPRLVIEKLNANDDIGQPIVRDLSLTVNTGEIVGIAGVSGNGQSQLVEVLAGQRPATGGSVSVSGSVYTPTRKNIRDRKVNLLPEVPLLNACAPDMSVSENIALRDFDVPPIAMGRYFVSPSAIGGKARALIAAFGVRTPSPDSPIRNLSGGNVQRSVLARELSDACDVLITANPCFGLDFAATATIRSKIIDARNSGAAVLLVSGDLDELLEISDRICVMFHGQIVYETPAEGADVRTIGKYMAGHGTE